MNYKYSKSVSLPNSGKTEDQRISITILGQTLSSGGVDKPPVTTFAQAYLALSKNPEPEIMDGKAAEEGSIDVKKSGVLPHNNTSISNEKNTDGKSVANKITSTHGPGARINVATVNPAPVQQLPANNIISDHSKAPLAIIDSASSLLGKESLVPLSIVLNVGGQKFETKIKNFTVNFPSSRLWKLAHAIEAGAGTDEILQICDRFKRGNPGSKGKKEIVIN